MRPAEFDVAGGYCAAEIGSDVREVTLRGFRIDLARVDAALMRLPDVRQAAAGLFKDASGRDRLVACLVADRDPGLAAVQRRLGARLPHHMVPSALIVRAALPMTSTGRIDLAALRPPPDIGPETHGPEAFGISPVEETILNAFRLTLDRPDIGLDDEFFASGGDSLVAVEVAMEIERLLCQTIPVALLAHDGTARMLAAMLEDIAVEPLDRYVTLQPKGRDTPLFCLHDLYGRALSHASLARRLAPHKPVHGLLVGPIQDEITARPSMETLIAAHVATIRSVRPSGPYQISGFSFCGPFAHEIACALEAAGETVSLILIDSPILMGRPGVLSVMRGLLAAGGARGAWRAIRASRSIWLRWLLPRLPISLREIPGFVPRCDRAVARAIMQMRVGWHPRTFKGRTLILRSTIPTPMDNLMDADGLQGWRVALAGPVTVMAIDGAHNDIMREPLVADVADAIRAEMAFAG